MTISGQIRGEPVKREYRFRTTAELRAANPEAYKLYAEWMSESDKLPQNVSVQIRVQTSSRP